MKYRIKKPEVEQAVRGLFKTQEAFEKELNHWSEHHFKYHPYYNQLKIEANSAESITGFTCELYVATSDVEEVDEQAEKSLSEYEVTKINAPKFPEPELIVLTVDEAKQLLKGCSTLCGLFHALNMSDNFNEMIKLTVEISNRIEQVEKAK